MVFIRPVSLKDLDQLLGLANQAGVGLTTLPKDPELLRKRVLKSIRSLETLPDRPGGETYLFVMEDADSGKVVGATGIVSKVGGFEPFYGYRIKIKTHASEFLHVRKQIPVLHLSQDHNGPAEIGSLFLSPEYRKKDNGRLLQLCRFLFVAEHPEIFEPVVVSELRGVIDEAGHSPFWDAVGRHFFEIDFPEADRLSVVNKKFIADLMPTHPIYIPLLPPEAQKVIGQVHESSRPALKNLEGEGFRFNKMVDIFDAGPCVSCKRDGIRSVRESRSASVVDFAAGPIESPSYMFGTSGSEFRACTGGVHFTADGVRIAQTTADLLRIRRGDRIRYALLRPEVAVATEKSAAVKPNEVPMPSATEAAAIAATATRELEV